MNEMKRARRLRLSADVIWMGRPVQLDKTGALKTSCGVLTRILTTLGITGVSQLR